MPPSAHRDIRHRAVSRDVSGLRVVQVEPKTTPARLGGMTTRRRFGWSSSRTGTEIADVTGLPGGGVAPDRLDRGFVSRAFELALPRDAHRDRVERKSLVAERGIRLGRRESPMLFGNRGPRSSGKRQRKSEAYRPSGRGPGGQDPPARSSNWVRARRSIWRARRRFRPMDPRPSAVSFPSSPILSASQPGPGQPDDRSRSGRPRDGQRSGTGCRLQRGRPRRHEWRRQQ